MQGNLLFNPDVLRTNIMIDSLESPNGCDFWIDLPFIPRVNDAIVLKDFVDFDNFNEEDTALIKDSHFKVLTIEWCSDEFGLFQTIVLLGFIDSIVDKDVYEIEKIMVAERFEESEYPIPPEKETVS